MKRITLLLLLFLVPLCLTPQVSGGVFYLAHSGSSTGSSRGSYVSTHVSDDVNFYIEAIITGSTYNSTFYLNFQGVPSQVEITIEYFFNRSSGTGTFDDGGIQLYNHTSDAWVYLYNDVDWQGSEVSRSFPANSSSGIISLDGVLNLRATLELTDGGGGTDFGLYIDFCQAAFYEWQDVGEARLIFPIGWDPTFQFGYDAVFIFAGLIMMPLSTMLLVRGGRKGMSTDKLFYDLLVFMIGFGLLVGGIMP